jgi:hypothetical protein
MSKTRKKQAPKSLSWLHIEVLFDLDTETHWGQLTRFTNGQAIYTVQASSPGAFRVVQDLFEGATWADTDLRSDHMLLPDMGDFQITYYEPEGDESHLTE